MHTLQHHQPGLRQARRSQFRIARWDGVILLPADHQRGLLDHPQVFRVVLLGQRPQRPDRGLPACILQVLCGALDPFAAQEARRPVRAHRPGCGDRPHVPRQRAQHIPDPCCHKHIQVEAQLARHGRGNQHQPARQAGIAPRQVQRHAPPHGMPYHGMQPLDALLFAEGPHMIGVVSYAVPVHVRHAGAPEPGQVDCPHPVFPAQRPHRAQPHPAGCRPPVQEQDMCVAHAAGDVGGLNLVDSCPSHVPDYSTHSVIRAVHSVQDVPPTVWAGPACIFPILHLMYNGGHVPPLTG